MNGDVSIVEDDRLAVVYKGKVISIHFDSAAIFQAHIPVQPSYRDNKYLVTFFVKERIEPLRRA